MWMLAEFLRAGLRRLRQISGNSFGSTLAHVFAVFCLSRVSMLLAPALNPARAGGTDKMNFRDRHHIGNGGFQRESESQKNGGGGLPHPLTNLRQ